MLHAIKLKNLYHKNLESSKNVLKARQIIEKDIKDFNKKLFEIGLLVNYFLFFLIMIENDLSKMKEIEQTREIINKMNIK